MANARGNPENLKPIRTTDEAKKRGAAGGKKSGAVRRKKRDAKQAISLLLDMAAKDNLDKNLKQLGYDEEDCTNMNALTARIFAKAMSGDVAAFKALMDYGGFNPDQKLKDKERETKIKTFKDGKFLPLGNEDPGEEKDGEDVIIYLPDNGRNSNV